MRVVKELGWFKIACLEKKNEKELIIMAGDEMR